MAICGAKIAFVGRPRPPEGRELVNVSVSYIQSETVSFSLREALSLTIRLLKSS